MRLVQVVPKHDPLRVQISWSECQEKGWKWVNSEQQVRRGDSDRSCVLLANSQGGIGACAGLNVCLCMCVHALQVSNLGSRMGWFRRLHDAMEM